MALVVTVTGAGSGLSAEDARLADGAQGLPILSRTNIILASMVFAPFILIDPLEDLDMQSPAHPLYAVTPDDQRFVMLRVGEADSDTELILVDNWAEELKERVGN